MIPATDDTLPFSPAIIPSSPSEPGIVIKGLPGQTESLLILQDSNGVELASFDEGGRLAINRSGEPFGYGVVTTGQLVGLSRGAVGAPDTQYHPVLKVERVIQLSDAVVSGDGSEQGAAISGNTKAVAGSTGQAIGVYGGAQTYATAGNFKDAVAVYGQAYVGTGGTGAAIGGAFYGHNAGAASHAVGLEAGVRQASGIDHPLNEASAPQSMGIWVTNTGPNKAGTGIQVGNPAGYKFDAGIVFGSDNPIVTVSFLDAGNAARSIHIKGSHTTAAIEIADGAGNIVFGTTTGTKIGTSTTQKIGFWGVTPVVRPTGWSLATGTATRTTFATGSVTLSALAEHVKALIDDLVNVGLIGA